MDSILRLEIVVKAKTSVVENGVVRDCQGQALLCGPGCCYENTTAWIAIEAMQGMFSVDDAETTVYNSRPEVF